MQGLEIGLYKLDLYTNWIESRRERDPMARLSSSNISDGQDLLTLPSVNLIPTWLSSWVGPYSLTYSLKSFSLNISSVDRFLKIMISN